MQPPVCGFSGEQKVAQGQLHVAVTLRISALSLQSSTQEIGEELINGVIYSISLRKVQLHHGATKGQRWLGVSAGVGSPP